MLLKRGHAAVVAALAVVGGAYFGCTGGESTPSSPTAGAAGAGSGAGGKVGGMAGTGSKPQGGSAGAAGGGPNLKWGAPVSVGSCSVRVLQNPEEARLFTWAPCSWTADPACEEAAWTPAFTGEDPSVWQGAYYQTNLESKVEGGNLVVTGRLPARAFLTNQEGFVKRGADFDMTDKCGPSTGRPLGDRMLFNTQAKDAPHSVEHPCFLDDGGLTCTTFDHLCDAPAWNEATDTHWGWECSSTIYAMSNKDGSQQKVLAQQNTTSGPVYDVDNLVASKKHLFWTEHVDFEGHVARRVSYTNGVDPPKVLLPPGPGWQDDGFVLFGGNRLVWTRGYDFVDLGVYKKVELWTSPWDDDNPGVTPTKVMDWLVPTTIQNTYSAVLASAGMQTTAGRLARAVTSTSLEVLDLSTLQTKTLVLPSTQEFRKVLGLTSTHLWFLTYDYPGPPYLRHMIRWKVGP